MKWWVKNSEVAGLDCWFDTYEDAVVHLRGGCGEGYYLDIEFRDMKEFVEWMNNEFLDPHNHGKLCKIGRMDSEHYWFDYLRPLGCDIAWCVANGVEQGWYRKSDDYVQYIEGDGYFVTFSTIDDYYDEVMSKEDLLYELECRV